MPGLLLPLLLMILDGILVPVEAVADCFSSSRIVIWGQSTQLSDDAMAKADVICQLVALFSATRCRLTRLCMVCTSYASKSGASGAAPLLCFFTGLRRRRTQRRRWLGCLLKEGARDPG